MHHTLLLDRNALDCTAGELGSEMTLSSTHSSTSCSYAFWLDQESTYHQLAQPAEGLVLVPASQVHVERLFPLCGELTAGSGTEQGCPCMWTSISEIKNDHVLS